jgi:FAD/FMN-containing dehydrogenase
MAVEVENGAMALDWNELGLGPHLIACAFEEKGATVDWQIATLKKELVTSPVTDVRSFSGADAVKLLALFAHAQLPREDHVALKATTTPSGVAAVLGAAVGYSGAKVHAHAGSGIVWVHLPTELGVERVSSVIAELTKLTTHNGNVTVRRCPPAWKAVLPVWGKDRGDREVMRAIKRTLDPDDVFNPGRLV